jgi:nitroreductase/dihydropteridine reductase
MSTISSLQWRYATKQFDSSKALAGEDLEYILEAGNLAATSYGLQPFTMVVVTDEAKKQALVPHAYNQVQVGTNGALVVLAARTDVDATFIAEYTARMENERGLPAGAVDGYKDMMVGHLTSLTAEARLVWAQKQAYIALGTMMVAAAERQVDNAPMEGFDPVKFNELLGLEAHNLHATVILALGHRSSEDASQNYKKIRRPLTDIVVRM